MDTSNSLTIIEQNHPALQPSANPVAVYLASLGTGSRRAIRQTYKIPAGDDRFYIEMGDRYGYLGSDAGGYLNYHYLLRIHRGRTD